MKIFGVAALYPKSNAALWAARHAAVLLKRGLEAHSAREGNASGVGALLRRRGRRCISRARRYAALRGRALNTLATPLVPSACCLQRCASSFCKKNERRRQRIEQYGKSVYL